MGHGGNPHWDGKVHKAVKVGDALDPRSVEGRRKVALRSARIRREKERRYLIASRNAGAAVSVSALALIVRRPIFSSFAQ